MVINFPFFNPVDFIRVAENLSNGSEESYFRTSIGRSYYSVFLEARTKLENRGTKFVLQRPGDIHEEIILKLKKYKLGNIADKIVYLRRLRRKSDYILDEIVDQQMARKALRLAKDICALIQQELS